MGVSLLALHQQCMKPNLRGAVEKPPPLTSTLAFPWLSSIEEHASYVKVLPDYQINKVSD